MITFLTTSIAAETLLAGVNAPSSADPVGFAGSLLSANALLERGLPRNELERTGP